jgi:hypothetical protein
VIAGIAQLPRSVRDAPTTVRIEVHGNREVWTRWFGDTRPMRSRLSASDGLLVERLGPVTLRFRLAVVERGVDWDFHSVRLVGVPLPRRWFLVQARSADSERGYHFVVAVRLVGVGELIRYDGVFVSGAGQ